ncbi:hypothetical protein A4G18_06360 [Pasteurellaceae bacterium Pebbles2]|nr:hypothetical protein [Pasteurellaceae bacterium Pebbles2]
MKTSINLLPWRTAQHQQRSRRALWVLAAFFLFCLFANVSLNQLAEHYRLAYQQQQEKQRVSLQQLKLIEQKVKQAQARLQQNTPKSAVKISTDLLHTLFDLLTTLPVAQGELSELHFSATEFSLHGLAHNQAEFEQIHHFLKQYPPLNRLKLMQFLPQQDNSLQFEFQLQFDGMENVNALEDDE